MCTERDSTYIWSTLDCLYILALLTPHAPEGCLFELGGGGAGAGAGGIYLAYCTQHAVYNITRHAVQHNEQHIPVYYPWCRECDSVHRA